MWSVFCVCLMIVVYRMYFEVVVCLGKKLMVCCGR